MGAEIAGELVLDNPGLGQNVLPGIIRANGVAASSSLRSLMGSSLSPLTYLLAITYLHIPLDLPGAYIYSPVGFPYSICPTVCAPSVSGGLDRSLQLGTG